MLLLPVLFLTGLLIAWLLMRRHQATLSEQIEKLRADRRRLSQKLIVARDRLVERRQTAELLRQDKVRLSREQDRLESEHAELAVRYANLQAAGAGGPAGSARLATSPADKVGEKSVHEITDKAALGAGFTKASRQMGQAFLGSTDGHYAKWSGEERRQTTDEIDSAEDWVADTEPLNIRPPRPTSVEVPLTDLGPESLSEPDLSESIEGQTSIELVSTRFAETLVKFGDRRRPVRQQAIRTLKEMEPDLMADGPLSNAANDLPEELMLQLAEQDAEIERLKSQLAPLLGLPLAVSAREAERDRLAQQLKERDAQIESLHAELEIQQIDAVTTDRPESTVIALTANETTGLHQSPMPDQIDNLKRIRGIGPVLERMLNRLGIYQYQQIAAWTPDDVIYFDEQLKDFRGRIERDDWIVNARIQHQSKYGETSE
ncbi:MAG: hypothetical protein AB8C46_14905 [Burkholderiaceae bacterium]